MFFFIRQRNEALLTINDKRFGLVKKVVDSSSQIVSALENCYGYLMVRGFAFFYVRTFSRVSRSWQWMSFDVSTTRDFRIGNARPELWESKSLSLPFRDKSRKLDWDNARASVICFTLFRCIVQIKQFRMLDVSLAGTNHDDELFAFIHFKCNKDTASWWYKMSMWDLI